MPSAPTLERLYTLAELEKAGYGSRRYLMQGIKDRKFPAVMVGKSYKVFESDLPKLLVAAGSLLDQGPVQPRVKL